MIQKSFLILLIIAGTAGCTKKESAPADPQELLIAKGKQAYLNYCTACHAINPQKVGSIGPEVWNSSLELLEGKILLNQYPQGYTPKRTTSAMAQLPHLKEYIPAIHAYLNSKSP